MSDSTLLARLKALPREQLSQLRRDAAANASSGHALVAEAFGRVGIKRVYGVSGTPVDQIFAECAARDIRPISTCTQHAAVLMAGAGNYVAGRLEAAVVLSAGPAVTNATTGLLVARDNGWPLLVVGGRKPLDKEGIGYFQELDAIPILSPVTKLARTVRATADIIEVVGGAFATANTARRGPAYLDLPEDVLEGRAAPREAAPADVTPRREIDLAAVEQAVQVLATAKRPLLVIGEDIRWSFEPNSLRTLVERFGIPFITSPMGRGFLPDDHALCANEVRRSFPRHADVIVMAGAWFDWRFRFGTELAPEARIVHCDADATVLGKNVRAELTLLGEPGEFLARLAEALDGTAVPDWSEWHRSLDQSLREQRANREEWLHQRSQPMQPQELYLALRDVLPADAVVAVEGNICLAVAQKVLHARTAASWLDPGRNGIIGGSIPFALGAKLAAPERPVFALCSDTGFAMSAMELEAAVRHRIPIVIVIANNDGNGGAVRQRSFFPAEYPERFTQYLPGLRYERIVEIFGGHAESIREPAEVRPAVERALASGVPACLNVHLDPNAPHSGIW